MVTRLTASPGHGGAMRFLRYNKFTGPCDESAAGRPFGGGGVHHKGKLRAGIPHVSEQQLWNVSGTWCSPISWRRSKKKRTKPEKIIPGQTHSVVQACTFQPAALLQVSHGMRGDPVHPLPYWQI